MLKADMNSHKSVLSKAIEVGNLSEVKELITNDDLRMVDGEDSLFHLVCSNRVTLKDRRRDMIGLFVAKGVKINMKNSQGDTPLHLCVQTGDVNCVIYLIDQGAKINEFGKGGALVTSCAARVGELEILQILFSQRAKVDLKDHLGRSIIHQIFALPPTLKGKNTIRVIETLLEYGVNMNEDDYNGNKAIHYAALSGCDEAVQYFLNNGIAVDTLNKFRQPPLILASWMGELETARKLIKHGAHINKIDSYCNSIFNSACDPRALFWDPIKNDFNDKQLFKNSDEMNVLRAKKDKCITTLVKEMQVDINFPNIIGMTPLMNVAKGGFNMALKILIELKADVNKKDINGRTVLHHTFRETPHTDNQLQIILKELLKHKINVNQLDKFGNAAIHYAVIYPPEMQTKGTLERPMEFIRIENLMEERGALFKLLENGADSNLMGRGKNTPLHLACKYDTSDNHVCIRILRYFEADYSLVNNIGKSAMDIAKESDNKSLIDAMKKTYKHREQDDKEPCCIII